MVKERRGMLVEERIDVVKDPGPKKENRWDGGLVEKMVEMDGEKAYNLCCNWGGVGCFSPSVPQELMLKIGLVQRLS